ncbi:MAG TPA: hypothetical protein VMW69_12290, partial [Spirochaetia bacterium]|nr:hypothetical protein [Spirochaetia bacterium]
VQGYEVDLPLRYGGLNQEKIRARISDWKHQFAGFLGVDDEEVPEDSSINALVKERARELRCSADETRHWVAEQFAYGSFLHTYSGGRSSEHSVSGTLKVGATILDFGELVILGVPVEALVEIAFEWQARVEDETALVCGLFNGWAGYLPHARNFEEPGSENLYETVSTVFAPSAAHQLLATAIDLRNR